MKRRALEGKAMKALLGRKAATARSFFCVLSKAFSRTSPGRPLPPTKVVFWLIKKLLLLLS